MNFDSIGLKYFKWNNFTSSPQFFFSAPCVNLLFIGLNDVPAFSKSISIAIVFFRIGTKNTKQARIFYFTRNRMILRILHRIHCAPQFTVD